MTKRARAAMVSTARHLDEYFAPTIMGYCVSYEHLRASLANDQYRTTQALRTRMTRHFSMHVCIRT